MSATEKPPINGSFPLIVMKRRYFEAFAAGTKTIEYRLHRKPFTARVFYPGRWVRLAYSYNVRRHPSMLAIVRGFKIAAAFEHLEHEPLDTARARFEDLAKLYPGLTPETELAMITLRVVRSDLALV